MAPSAPKEVTNIIKKFKDSSPGQDNIHLEIIKLVVTVIVPTL